MTCIYILSYHVICHSSYEVLKWGDEIEYLLLKLDHDKKRVYVHCKTRQYLDKLDQHNCEFDMYDFLSLFFVKYSII